MNNNLKAFFQSSLCEIGVQYNRSWYKKEWNSNGKLLKTNSDFWWKYLFNIMAYNGLYKDNSIWILGK